MKERIKTILGFSLIELMVVIAIVGILSAIAIPSYRNYVIRAKITEALSLVQSYKNGLAEYYNINGSCPANDSLYYENYLGSIDLTEYVAWLTNYNAKANACGIHMGLSTKVYDYSGGHEQAPRLEFNYYYNDTTGIGTWKCENSTHIAIDENYFPNACK